MATNVIRATRLARTICSNTLLPMVLCDASVLPYQSLQNILAKRTLSTTSSLRAREWVTVTYEKECGEQVTVKGKEGDNLLDVAINNDVDLDGFGACEGTLACSTCHLIFKKEDYDKLEEPPTDEELDMLDLAYGLTDTDDKVCISLAGCGFLGVYLIGAVQYLQKQIPKTLQEAHIAGASAGALVGAGLVCGVPLLHMKYNMISAAKQAQNLPLGPFNPNFSVRDAILKGMEMLPPDAHVIASGKLHISLTRLPDFKNVLVSHWESREELMQTLFCSCFIPVFAGTEVPYFRGTPYIDGGYSGKLPRVGRHSLTISPYSGISHISPKDKAKLGHIYLAGHSTSLTWRNVVRYYRSLMPYPVHTLEHLCRTGFVDAERFFKKHKWRRQS
ncbi:patatin-like phospholipase domain-containing protein 4 isoform X1 [Oratosquilla oratoria]|uniref:patatin-like phospholipase domain-containing protein 4 isoform X1 n=1 Tax=Oratosquilla oratoria TaxID=337810 RepID=UPI003F76D71A